MTARAVAKLPPCGSSFPGSGNGISDNREISPALAPQSACGLRSPSRRLARAVLSIIMAGILGGAVLSGALLPGASYVGEARAAQSCSLSRIDLRPPGGAGQGERQSFAVEIADTAASRAQGLMYRETLAPDAGMLFIYDTPRRAEFWMKNTLIPLDIIFADASGRVRVVHENAVPGDETPIPGGDNVLYVLEINGGLAKKTGIGPGSEMRHPRITSGAWPC